MVRKLKRKKGKADDFAVAQAMSEAGALYSSGDLQGALERCQTLLKNHGVVPQALHMSGLAAFQLGDTHQAAKWLGKFSRLQKGDAEAQYNLGVVLQADGQLEASSRAYLSTVKIDPTKPEAYNNLGSVYEMLGRMDDAEAAFRKGMEVAPDRLESPNNLGLLLQNTGRLNEAEALFRGCLERAPNEPNVLNNLGLVLKEQGRFEEAVTVLKQALKVEPGNPMALNNLGLALQGEDRLEEAREAFNKVLFSHPGDVETHINLADLNFGLGDRQGAEKDLREVLKSDPANAKAYNLLMRVKKVSEPDDEDFQNLKRLLDGAGLDDEQRQLLNQALSDAYSALGDEVAAFDHLKRGNDAKAIRLPFDLKEEGKRFQAIQQTFSRAFVDTRQGGGASSNKPIFILGMPRSGTSLVEQILASHSDVFGAGELNDLGYQIERAGSFPDTVGDWTGDAFKAIGEAYEEGIAKKGDGAPRISDKMPANFMYIGIIRLALPNAKIIHCTRDAMDTCYSCYKQNFSTGQLFSNDLVSLGRYYRLYQEMMAHWHALFPGDIYDVAYEAVVENPEQSIRGLLGFCNLDWQDDCLNFHANKRQVRTASALQVRQPIYKSSLKAWTGVKAQLAPLQKTFED